MRKSKAQTMQARKEVRLAVVRQAEVVACTLSAAGGDLASLTASAPQFDMVIIDEVRPAHCLASHSRVCLTACSALCASAQHELAAALLLTISTSLSLFEILLLPQSIFSSKGC